MTQYVLYQRQRIPASIIGSIEAENLVAATNLARAMCDGSFFIVDFAEASFAQRKTAVWMDRLADGGAARSAGNSL